MKGFASVLVLLAFCALFAALLAREAESSKSSSRSAIVAISMLAPRYAELEFKHALGAALSSAQGGSREEMAAAAATRLASLEPFLEGRMLSRGIQADLWVGVASTSDLRKASKEGAAGRHPAKCGVCFDLGQASAGVLVVQGFIDASPSGRVFVSRTGSSFVRALSEYSFSHKGFAIGASFYFPASGVSSVAVAREGFP
ncbi:MAG: hypothetical protein V1708_02405 [Candidatus Micrarchaeota archaeon]